MKKRWLAGTSLGVSLALLLAGGVALAQGITITTSPEGCIDCSTRDTLKLLSPYSSGWLNNETVTEVAWREGEFLDDCPSCGQAVNGVCDDPHWLLFPCPGEDQISPTAFDVTVQANGDWRIGTHKFGLFGDESEREGYLTIGAAEDCSAAAFVLEPETVALLGSGLAGLAGYAALRWRARS